MPKITVTARITAGTHPVHGPIIQGQTYEIEEHQFAPQLFERPDPGWLAPWERKAEDNPPAEAPAKAKKKRR